MQMTGWGGASGGWPGWGWGVRERVWLGWGESGGGACTGGGGERGRGCPPGPRRARAPVRVCAGARAREPGRRLPSESVLAAQPAPPRPM